GKIYGVKGSATPGIKGGLAPLQGVLKGARSALSRGGAAPSWSAKKRSRPFLFFVARLIIM
ncbi:hypothetical protein, partial [Candidatus Magnetobacterium casense]|uniref:hypothetical protein n=1 Tax=Candidatus Magnetobacterium casense TaxID=1455061 RepID=UPI001C438546